MPVGTGLPSSARMPFNRPNRGLLLQMNREPINVNNDDTCYEALEAHQKKYDKDNDTQKDPYLFLRGTTVAVHQEDMGHGCME